ncbi:MAG TPA: hypothetical protein VH008_00615 [Pseudonocardia sp.]|nr:hypothetical protein [Pseudonocardia sp.]
MGATGAHGGLLAAEGLASMRARLAEVLLTDALPPAAYAVLVGPVPMPTVELTVHLGEALEEKPAAGWALVSMRSQQAGSGWAVDDWVVWSADGQMLALGRQTRRVLQPAGERAHRPPHWDSAGRSAG